MIFPQQKLINLKETYDEYARLGQSTAISGNYAFISAPKDTDDNNDATGSVYIFERNTSGTWIKLKRLIPTDMENNDYFGGSIAVSGNYLIVSTVYHGTGGAAYIYERNTSTGIWPDVETKKITASIPVAGKQFGCSVAIDGDYAIVGERQYSICVYF